MGQNEKLARPKWQRDMEMFIPIYHNYILGGAIHDSQYYEKSGKFYSIERLLKKMYSDEYRFIVYDMVRGEGQKISFRERVIAAVEGEEVQDASGDTDPEENALERIFSGKFDEEGKTKNVEYKYDHNDSGATLDLAKLGEMLVGASMEEDGKTLGFQQPPKKKRMVLIKSASRLSVRPGEVGGAEELKLYSMLFDIMARNKNNKIIILVEKFNDLPNFIENESNNPFIKKLLIVPPETDFRRAFFTNNVLKDCKELNAQFLALQQETDGAKKTEDVVRKFSVYTDGYSNERLLNLACYMKNKGESADITKLGTEITLFESGDPDNPWNPETRNQIAKLKEKCGEVIKGQDRVLQQAQEIMSLAATGLNRLDNATAPRAVLFLAGPTGTGKTELAKQIAKIVFGREDKMVRFDMSEFAHDHSDARLFGAPPGYVGYEAGGELTNAAKEKPFSVFLFDEIEKAHPRILDKFLQILSDGRLTSGKGETVWFSDSIIIMTSNAGIKPQRSQEDILREIAKSAEKGSASQSEITIEEYGEGGAKKDKMDWQLRENLKSFFSDKIERPELFGRLENSIITYDFIGKEAAKAIAAGRIKKIVESAATTADINIVDYSAAANAIGEYVAMASVRALGGRGVISNTDKLFVRTLSDFVVRILLKRDSGAGTITLRPVASGQGDALSIAWEETSGQ